MNLPIKLIDIVTLLFLTLLVVIIIFITLQRNIKRYKLRNIKDPHFHICKSIPKELRENISNKHENSKIYKEPPQLFTNVYHFLSPDQTQSFVFRLKAFDTSKNLESALYECGFSRQFGTKFEEFLISLLEQENNLPKRLLKQFIIYYKWILIDPKKFEINNLREMNLLINKIINELSSIYKNDQILKHVLDLEPNGDYNIEMKLNTNSNDNLSNNNYINNQTTNNNSQSSLARKLFKNISKFKLRKKNEGFYNKNFESTENKNDNLNRQSSSSFASNTNILKKNKNKSLNELKDINQWSIINESIKTFDDDSENEEIPLVVRDKKGGLNSK